MAPDVRWKQRFANYKRALIQLKKFCDKGVLNELEEQGLIKAFEYSYELAWNVIKDFYEEQGESSLQGSKDAFRLAYTRGLITQGEIWMDMVESRKLTVHTYQDEMAARIVRLIQQQYFNLFLELRDNLENLATPQLPLT
ncbi:MAG: nucleotidyltransferase substrate binding protein [Cyclobacteriaceae bacterium]|nr:nucleotidyltransferase substrate binding protein [Cyclobacteriaceae bacterium]